MVAFRDICPRLGHVTRVYLDLGRPQKKDPGRIAVRWPCGCQANGETLTKVALHPCTAHTDLALPPRQPARQAASRRS